MSYSERISEVDNLTMDKIIEVCLNNIPQAYRIQPYRHPELNHGIDLLHSEEAMDCYIGAYGEMHQAKCRAALQNLPFPPNEALRPSLSLEIIDWGCGQGIGSICVIDYLKEHSLTIWLKKITLIEPSTAALNRACANVIKATNHGVRVIPINKYLPSTCECDDIRGLNYEYNYVIHIFSNILDVNNIDLAKLARHTAIPGPVHYFICTGPLNANSFKIDRFCEIFQPAFYFSDICSNQYGHTSMNYYYTCKSKGFIYDGTPLKLEAYNPNETATGPVFEEYDPQLHIQNKLMSHAKARIYYRLQKILSPADLIYLDADINGAIIDFVIVRPHIGIILISVFEADPEQCILIKDSSDPDSHDNTGAASHDRKEQFVSPYSVLENYQNLLIEHIKEFTDAVIQDVHNLSLVQKVLVCTKCTRNQVIDLLGSPQYITIYGKEIIQNLKVPFNLYDDTRLIYYTPIFTDDVLRQLKKTLSPEWHSYREGIEIIFTPQQKKLSLSKAGAKQKISGVAGSGKTQVLAARAVNAQIRTGGDVLILTFNTTLVNYMRMKISQVRADFPWSKIHIDYYHHFFRKYANVNHLCLYFESYDNVDFFYKAHNLSKFDAIFIDEVQDYAPQWIQILSKYFLKKKGEFVVFGDSKQNIYQRETDDAGDIIIDEIPGSWNKELTKGQRFLNPALTELAVSFLHEMMDTDTVKIEFSDLLSNFSKEFQFNIIQYTKIPSNQDTATLAEAIYTICKNFIEKYHIEFGDVAILAPQIDLLRHIDYRHRVTSKKSTTVTFVRNEDEKEISSNRGIATANYLRDYDRLEKIEKKCFTMQTPNLKLSTIHSFKGWEAPTVICIIQNSIYGSEELEPEPELIYTAITRAKENLLIINIGDNQYDDFFKGKVEVI